MDNEVILYLTAANGEVMRVPESKLKDFQHLNEKIKERQEQKEKNTYENKDEIRFSLEGDDIPNLFDLWGDVIEEFGIPPKTEKQEHIDNPSQMKGNNMKKNRINKTYILIAVYIILIITELFLVVPYNKIHVYVSNQNVPHSVTTGSGYATLDDITHYSPFVYKENIMSIKKVNTPQIFINVSITTFLAVAVYLLLRNKGKVNGMPVLDINSLAFADEDTIAQAQMDYAKQMAEYVKNRKEIF